MWEVLGRLREEGALVDIERERYDEVSFRGFVTSVTNDFTLLSLIDSSCNFNGATVIQTEDVTLIRVATSKLEARLRVLQESPSSPDSFRYVDLSSWESILRSVAGRESVLSVHRERVDGSICHCLTDVTVHGDSLEADEIGTDGSIEGRIALRIDDLTRIDFGGGYERTLRRMRPPAGA